MNTGSTDFLYNLGIYIGTIAMIYMGVVGIGKLKSYFDNHPMQKLPKEQKDKIVFRISVLITFLLFGLPFIIGILSAIL